MSKVALQVCTPLMLLVVMLCLLVLTVPVTYFMRWVLFKDTINVNVVSMLGVTDPTQMPKSA